MMKPVLRRISLLGFLVVCVFLILGGGIYVFTTDIMPYHRQALHPVALNGFDTLYFGLMRGGGSATIALAVLALYVTLGPLRRGEPFAAEALLLAIGGLTLSSLGTATQIASQTGADTPQAFLAVQLGILIVSYGLSKLSGHDRER